MQKIKTLEKTLVSDNGEITLRLCLISDKKYSLRGCREIYSIVAETNDFLSFVYNVGESLSNACKVFNMLYDNSVTPITLNDIMADLNVSPELFIQAPSLCIK